MASNDIRYVVLVSNIGPKKVSLLSSEPNSRYKCRQMEIQTVGKNKMMRTTFVNIHDVAKDMKVPQSCNYSIFLLTL